MKTILQKITDTLEAGGISVNGIETYPIEDDENISVSLRVCTKSETSKDDSDDFADWEKG